MAKVYTESDFDQLRWHDCHIWGFELRAGDAEEGEWVSDLVLDIDFIESWLCGVSGGAQFKVAPATLVFHGVTDLRIDINWGDSGFQCALLQASIHQIERALVPNQKIFLDRPYYCWTIRLNWPESGTITFGAAGFTQTLRSEGILTHKQRLSLAQRLNEESAPQ